MDDLLREFLTETNESLDVVDVELVGGALSWLAQVGEGGGPLDESLKRGSLGVRRKRTNSPVGRIGMG